MDAHQDQARDIIKEARRVAGKNGVADIIRHNPSRGENFAGSWTLEYNSWCKRYYYRSDGNIVAGSSILEMIEGTLRNCSEFGWGFRVE